MTLLVTADELRARRAAVAGPLAPLAQSLAGDVEPLLDRELFIPPEKALLSRDGGRCPRHGVLLEFDPDTPREHRCPMCGERYAGDLHYRFWIYWYQLWLVERATIGATLAVLGAGERFADLARSILRRYAARYTSYPNSDNVLGPTRLFFSTYLESIWLLHVCLAVDLLEETGDTTIGGEIRDRIIEPSAAIIAGYDEGGSNRQVWNDAALLAAARLLHRDNHIDEIVYGASGIAGHLATGVLADGSWYEGENYHLFAHRGLWYGVTMAARAGAELPDSLVSRFDAGFIIPFATALPDLTMPSRRDSQYAISLRQWRIAEHCELGLARTGDPELRGSLARLYTDDVPRRDTGRRRSSADVERNEPATALDRRDLSWRALLHARPVLPAGEPASPRSALLAGQGIGVFRRQQGRAYVAVDYGHSGGDHGHPDRLNLLLVDGTVRWLDDMGTGSYVDPSLHWYRSTLAHNAPLVNGRSQSRVHGTLLAYDERGAAGWISASAEEIAPGASVARTVVVMPDYMIDELEWRADGRTKVDLPLHVDATVVSGAGDMHEDRPSGSDGLEDGFRFLESASMQRSAALSVVELRASRAGATHPLRIWWHSDTAAEWWRALAPGAPGRAKAFFRFVRALGDHGRHRSVWCWGREVAAVRFDDEIVVTLDDDTTHAHRRTDRGWHVELSAGTSRSSIDLEGWISDEAAGAVPPPREPPAPARAPTLLHVGPEHVVELEEPHYRRSEESWKEAGSPSATVALSWSGSALRVVVTVYGSDLTFVPPAAVNPYDNEPMDINGDGVQIFLRTDGGRSGWILVPERDSTAVRIRAIDGWTTPHPIGARWKPIGDGYELHVDLPMAATTSPVFAIDVVINEKPAGRERRRGQLVMSGAAGEFVYLRGDRHDERRLMPFQLVNV
jgi:hypothetical protein